MSIHHPDIIAATPILDFIAEHQTELWHVARLIGGYGPTRLVDGLVETLQQERRLTRRTWIMLDQLLDLLALESIDGAACCGFGAHVPLDPADPAVTEICLLTDGLRAAIDAADVLRRGFADTASAEKAA